MAIYIKKYLKNDLLISIIIAISFFIFSVSLPIYDTKNGFHNLIFDNYKLTWYDGRSPANFYITKNLLEGKSIFFPKGYLIDNIEVENNVDFLEKDGFFIPMYNFLGNYIYAGILGIVPISSDLQLFKSMVFLTMLFSAITLSFFYLVQRLLDLNIKYSILSTFIAGIATSILIYSKYLFIDHTIMGMMFVLLIYILLKNQKKRSFKIEIFAMIIFSFFILFLWSDFLILVFFIILSYFFIKYKFIGSKKILIFPIIFISLTLISIYLFYSDIVPRTHSPGIKEIIKIMNLVPVFRVFSSYINALDYSIFGYHNLTSVWKLSRQFAFIYVFEEPKGNAIFLSMHGLFGSLFGPKGIIFNSPYFIFSIIGIFIYKRKSERNLLLAIIILIILVYGLIHFMWFGGFTPRYNRYFTIPVLFLTFFSFYWMQETKNNLAKIIFFILVILSILNVTSLAIRADWTYEHETDLVSYDIVLWPWVNPKSSEGGITFYLTSKAEQLKWKDTGSIECRAEYFEDGIFTEPCECIYYSSITRQTAMPNSTKTILIEACASEAGEDGTKGEIFIDNKRIGEIIIPSYLCDKYQFDITKYADEKSHEIKLKSNTYGNCTGEGIMWKIVKLSP